MGLWGPGSDFYKIDVFLKMGDGARHFKNHPHNPPPAYVSMYCELSHGGGILYELRVAVASIREIVQCNLHTHSH